MVAPPSPRPDRHAPFWPPPPPTHTLPSYLSLPSTPSIHTLPCCPPPPSLPSGLQPPSSIPALRPAAPIPPPCPQACSPPSPSLPSGLQPPSPLPALRCVAPSPPCPSPLPPRLLPIPESAHHPLTSPPLPSRPHTHPTPDFASRTVSWDFLTCSQRLRELAGDQAGWSRLDKVLAGWEARVYMWRAGVEGEREGFVWWGRWMMGAGATAAQVAHANTYFCCSHCYCCSGGT